jgi:hypothetical protein
MRKPRNRAVLLIAIMLPAFAGTAQAQTQVPAASVPDWRVVPTAGVGFVGNLPRALLGGTGYLFLPMLGGTGVYADFRTTHESLERHPTYTADITVEQAETEFGDFLVERREHWQVGNIGLIRPLTPDFAVFAGVGFARERVYRDYLDLGGERGVLGNYRVQDHAESGNRLNGGAGAILRAGRSLAFHMGIEGAPRGFMAGASLVLPVR